ncbi:ribonuclease H-like domain-containing protein [Tanacetum coccineum]
MGTFLAPQATLWIGSLNRTPNEQREEPLDLKDHRATLVYCDNVSAVYMSANPVQHQRTKHIEIDIHFVRDKVAAGHVRVLHAPSRLSVRKYLHKSLPFPLIADFNSSLKRTAKNSRSHEANIHVQGHALHYRATSRVQGQAQAYVSPPIAPGYYMPQAHPLFQLIPPVNQAQQFLPMSPQVQPAPPVQMVNPAQPTVSSGQASILPHAFTVGMLQDSAPAA